MANNRLVAVCIHSSHTQPFPRKTILKYYPKLHATEPPWTAPDGNDQFFMGHKHGPAGGPSNTTGLWGNYIVFLPEIRGIDELNKADDGKVALLIARTLHGTETPD